MLHPQHHGEEGCIIETVVSNEILRIKTNGSPVLAPADPRALTTATVVFAFRSGLTGP